MSNSRIFRAFMSLFAFAVVLAVVGPATANAAATGTVDSSATSTPGQTTTPDAPSDAPAPRRHGPVKLKVADHSVNFGGRFRLRGRTGNPYHGQVRIQARTGSAWKTLRKVKTDRKGRFQLKVRARNSTRLRALAADGRRSKVRRVTVLGYLKVASSARYVRLGRALVIRGTVYPRGARTIRVRVRGRGAVTTRARANGRFRVRWVPRNHGDFSYLVRALTSARSTGSISRSRRFSALRPGHASYYGPGLYGNGVACGGTLTPSTRGVANKSLPCGTRVTLQYGNRTVVARVIDRGPYVAGRDWDLTEQTKRDLGFGGVGVVWTNK